MNSWLWSSACRHWSAPNEYSNTFAPSQFFAEVVKLDEQLLIFHRDRMPELDNNLPGIHHIGSDLRFYLEEKRLSTYVVDAPTIHKYASGKRVINKQQSTKIQDRGSLTYLEDKAVCDNYIRRKWPNYDIPQCSAESEPEELQLGAARLAQIDAQVIILSRGGSGSRLASLLVQDASIFLGSDISGTQDSMEFVR